MEGLRLVMAFIKGQLLGSFVMACDLPLAPLQGEHLTEKGRTVPDPVTGSFYNCDIMLACSSAR